MQTKTYKTRESFVIKIPTDTAKDYCLQSLNFSEKIRHLQPWEDWQSWVSRTLKIPLAEFPKSHRHWKSTCKKSQADFQRLFNFQFSSRNKTGGLWFIQIRNVYKVHSSLLITKIMLLVLVLLNELQSQSTKQIHVSTYCHTKSPRIKSNFILELEGKENTDLQKF